MKSGQFSFLGLLGMAFYIMLHALCFSGCGEEPLLYSGRYNVTITYLASDWGVKPGDQSSVEWDIDEEDGHYTVQVVGGSGTKLHGDAEGKKIVFSHYQDMDNSPDDGCDDFNQLDFTLNPYDSRKQFDGTGHSELHMCNVSPCGMMPLPVPECEPVEASIEESVNLTGKLRP